MFYLLLSSLFDFMISVFWFDFMLYFCRKLDSFSEKQTKIYYKDILFIKMFIVRNIKIYTKNIIVLSHVKIECKQV